MTEGEFFDYVLYVCGKLRSPWYITGSFASSFYGEQRATADLDIVIDFRRGDVPKFIEAFADPDRFYMSREAMQKAVMHGGMFNIILVGSNFKADVIVPAMERSYDEIQFKRLPAKSPDSPSIFVSPEDLILNKLLFYKEGGSEKHIRDITSILRVQGEAIDRAYIDEWAERLKVRQSWRMIVRKVDAAG